MVRLSAIVITEPSKWGCEMDKKKLEYEKPEILIKAVDLEDVITTSNPEFDGGQSGLSVW